ncbi:MAG: DUF4443 domain-containing protein [Candidatus Methanomethylophilaceae archaeon]
MKIIDEPRYGPMFRFSDANVYWTLHLLSEGTRTGRKRLADMVGIGEGSMRRIIDALRDMELISIKQTGVSITDKGIEFLEDIPIRVIDLDVGDSVSGDETQSLLVLGVSDRVHNGMQQRDAGIKVGATSCTTFVIRNGVLMVPPDWNVDQEKPELAEKIRNELGMSEKDAIIVGGAPTKVLAVEATVAAALDII